MNATPHPNWPNLQLNNGMTMPAVGFGTYKIRNREQIFEAVDSALAAGYRLFDTSAMYGNEQHLKYAFKNLLPKYGLERDDIFITSKLSNCEIGSKKNAIKAYERSLSNLGVDFLDLYLVQFPAPSLCPHQEKRNKDLRNKSWTGLVELYDTGRVSSIGVSNYTIDQLQDLMKENHTIPVVNQVEWHPYYFNKELLGFMYQHEIVLQAHHSLGGAELGPNLRSNPVVVSIAKELDAKPSQVLLVWALRNGAAVMPKSISPHHIRENFNLDIKLSPEHIKKLDQLNGTAHKYSWNAS